MRSRGLIDGASVRRLVELIRAQPFRYPAIDAGAFEAKVREALQHG